jgi:hypothetical protein
VEQAWRSIYGGLRVLEWRIQALSNRLAFDYRTNTGADLIKASADSRVAHGDVTVARGGMTNAGGDGGRRKAGWGEQ